MVWPNCVCVLLLSIFLSEFPCRFSPLSPERYGHMVYWLLLLPRFCGRACSTRGILVIETDRFLGILARQRGKDGGPSRITFGRSTRKGSIISGVLLADMQHSHVSPVLK